jgi:hypothetical protein
VRPQPAAAADRQRRPLSPGAHTHRDRKRPVVGLPHATPTARSHRSTFSKRAKVPEWLEEGADGMTLSGNGPKWEWP